MKSLGAMANPVEGQVPWLFHREPLSFYPEDSGDHLTQLKPKTLRARIYGKGRPDSGNPGYDSSSRRRIWISFKQ